MYKTISRTAAAIAIVYSLGIATIPAIAHHSFALFDTENPIMLEGTVKTFEWSNPHSWIRLVVVGVDNRPEDWMIELPAAASLARDGWNKNFLRPGNRISVRISPLRNGMKGGSLQSFRPDVIE